jgi:hypothetical protein
MKNRQPRSRGPRQPRARAKSGTSADPTKDEVEKAAKELTDTVLSAADMEETEDYLTRGRRFQRLSIEDLRQRWTAGFKGWNRDRTRELQREFDDAAAELRLRGSEPPLDTVGDEIAALRNEAARGASDGRARETLRVRIEELLFPRRRSSH